MKEKKQKLYMAPVVKTVDFVVEGVFAGSPNTINQPSETENDGMYEQMDYQTTDEQQAWGWQLR
jgi:hypothetical protein